MADVVSAFLIDATFSRVISAASELIKLAGGRGKKNLKRLQAKLDQVHDVLFDADEKQYRNQAVRRWLEKLEKVAREAEDVLDELVYEGLKRKVEIRGQRKKKVRLFFTHSYPFIFRLRMANKIKNLITSIDNINEEAREYNLQSRLAVSAPDSRSNPQTAYPFLGYCSQVMGRDDDISKLVDLLIDPSNKQPLSVISVVGMGGLGKTTLVRSVEKEEKIREHFGKIMSICVSEDFNVKKILEDMLECLSKESCSIRSESAIMEKIKEKLENKNYLLILDDVWNENELVKWEELRGCLLEINKNKVSRVVVTTRSTKVASTMGTRDEHVYHLKQLKPDECWSIIKQRVFGDSLAPDQELVKIGRQIAKKCRGVPLVANVIGASLSTRIDRLMWLSVQNSDAWDSLKDDNTGRGILGVLQSSFDRLPNPALKNCFAFCSIFPKDYVYERNSLVQLWMAGGLLQPSEGSSVAILEDIGGKYFDDFLSYSLFQPEERDSRGKITHCKMHDLIHDLAMSNSESETLMLKAASRGNIARVRHLNLNLVDDMETVPTNFEEVAGKLHALFLNSGILCKLPECFKRVRILVVHVQYNSDGRCFEQLPTWIGKMKHLRYLDISETRIKELPQFIMKLYNLQTLRFEYCDLIEKRPQGMENLVSLKHIYFSYEECAPVGIGRLADLQTLPFFVVGRQKGSQIEDLGSLSQLRGSLNICRLEFVENYIEAKKAKLCEKTRLHELVLKWGKWKWEKRDRGECKHDEDVLEGLQPPSSVQRLTIDNYGGEKCPTWMDCPLSGLFSLDIECCKMLRSIPTMRGFSALQELNIISCHELTGLGDDMSALPTSLRRLKIMCCPRLQTIVPGLSSLTCLEELEIDSCRNLRIIPSIDGLSSLQKLKILRCDGLVSVSLPTNLHSLIELNIFNCKNLRCIPEESLGCLVSLQKLSIGGFSEELEEFPGLNSIQYLHASLPTLELFGWKTLKYLPPQIQHLTSLRELRIYGFNQVEALPEWLGGLSSLQKLSIHGCNNLKYRPNSTKAMQRLSELPFLEIDGFPELEKKGPELSDVSRYSSTSSLPMEIEATATRAMNSLLHLLDLELDQLLQVVEKSDLLKKQSEGMQSWEIGQKPEDVTEQFEDFALEMRKFMLYVGDFVLDDTILNSKNFED